MAGPIVSYWRSLTPEQKELALSGLHGTVLALIAKTFRSHGVRLIEAAASNPGLVAAGVAAGLIYYRILSNIISKD